MRDKTLGALMMTGSIVGIIVYGYLIFLAPEVWQLWTMRITLFAAVGGVLAILAWIGYTLASTQPPERIPELEGERSAQQSERERS